MSCVDTWSSEGNARRVSLGEKVEDEGMGGANAEDFPPVEKDEAGGSVAGELLPEGGPDRSLGKLTRKKLSSTSST